MKKFRGKGKDLLFFKIKWVVCFELESVNRMREAVRFLYVRVGSCDMCCVRNVFCMYSIRFYACVYYKPDVAYVE